MPLFAKACKIELPESHTFQDAACLVGCLIVDFVKRCYWWQVVELDFLYPSEGVHRRWDNGYRITAMAATMDQSALILSMPRRRPRDETQETLRTSQFPSAHVKVCMLEPSLPPSLPSKAASCYGLESFC